MEMNTRVQVEQCQKK
nr:hypothetical protein [Jeotgalicoccus sp. WY2]